MTHPLIEACRRPGAGLNTAQLAEIVKGGLPAGSSVTVLGNQVVLAVPSADGKSDYLTSAGTVEQALVNWADSKGDVQ
jgi:hypothetical protein